MMLRKQGDGSSVNPLAYELYYLAPESPQSPRDGKRTSAGCNIFEDEGRVGQELSLSHEDRIVHKVSASFAHNMQTHKTWPSREL